jgi:hypothetical protein
MAPRKRTKKLKLSVLLWILYLFLVYLTTTINGIISSNEFVGMNLIISLFGLLLHILLCLPSYLLFKSNFRSVFLKKLHLLTILIFSLYSAYSLTHELTEMSYLDYILSMRSFNDSVLVVTFIFGLLSMGEESDI